MQTSPVRRYILNNLSQHQKDIVRAAARKFGLSRQAVLRHMKTLILDGERSRLTARPAIVITF